MTGRNFEKLRKDQAVSRLGYEPRDGMNLIPGKIRKRKIKAQLRAEAEGLTTPDTLITKMIECRCGHRGRVPSGRFEKSVSGAAAHQAALTKSLDDLIQSRPVELPPEAFVQANARPGRIYDADGNSVGVRYEIVEADDLITSNRDDLSINPAFPQELQPRDRSRAMSQDQISGIAANLQPERLGFSSDASTGAPVVGADGLVESGNGRVLAIRRAYQQDGVLANNYRNYLRSQNFDVEGIRNLVLIARRVTDLEDRVGFVTAANRSTAMRLGAAEQALSDARLLDGDLMSRLDGADIKATGNQAFTRGFMQKLPRSEQGNLIDKDGYLSQEGEPKPEVKPIMVDLGDGRGERDLADILREADDEIAAAREIEACAIGLVA